MSSLRRVPGPVSRGRRWRTLGVLGGMGPAATALFLRDLAAAVPATVDQDHPRVIVLSEPGIPDRAAALLDDGPSPAPAIKDGLLTLADWGAEVLAVPCNTAHPFIDAMREELPVPLVHIVQATIDAARRKSPPGAWLAATAATIRSDIYQKWAASVGYRLLIPTRAQQQLIDRTIAAVKASDLRSAAVCMTRGAEYLRSEEDVDIITACSELPLAYEAARMSADRQISSVTSLAQACVASLRVDESADSVSHAGRRRTPTSSEAT